MKLIKIMIYADDKKTSLWGLCVQARSVQPRQWLSGPEQRLHACVNIFVAHDVVLAEIRPGLHLSLTKGPFANFVVEVEKIAPDRRVWVLMEIMGGQTLVAVGADQLRAV